VGVIAAISLAITGLTGAFTARTTAAGAAAAGQVMTAVRGSLTPTTDPATGKFTSSRMSVEVALAPRDAAGMASQLAAVYDSGSSQFHHWLGAGQFAARYAPSSAQRSAVQSYLRSRGLAIQPSSSAFLVRAAGSSQQVASAFNTTLRTYKDPHGIKYFSNSSAVRLPASIANAVQGVVGLSNTVREQSRVVRVSNVARPSGRPTAAQAAASAGCETPYVTKQQLFDSFDNGISFPYGYGGGPGCNGLTPSQDNSIYGAPKASPRTQGAGVNAAVFELSAYQQSDISTWAQTFYGKHYHPSLTDVTVDGGPLNPVCPAADTCPPDFNGYSGDIEVDADIEMDLAIAPSVSHVQVYNAPNDFTGQTSLDEWNKIASDDSAAVVSSSWAVCENDAGAAYAQAENVVFEQMALQGQSVFGASGDTGAFSCIRSDGTTIVNTLDPPSQPWVTSVGGTSLETDNPGTNPHPAYPQGVETVWNVQNLCNSSADEGNQTGFFWCANGGAGGGGNSQFWGRPAYQRGPGVSNQFSTAGNGTTQCSLAKVGAPCREVPDISANADEYTPYAEFCTGNANTPASLCGTFSSGQTPPGWFGIGGTSLSSPFVSAIFADRVSFTGHRVGNANPLLYQLYNAGPGKFFHDITGQGQSTNNNGLFPTAPGYDLAVGIGSPRMAALITGR
jgi:kumamolisin